MKKIKIHENDEIITKGFLKSQFDIRDKRLDKRFDKTVIDIIDYIETRFVAYEDRLFGFEGKLSSLEEKMDHRFDRVMKTLDWLVGAFKKFDEEHTVLAGNYGEIKNQLTKHETRICYLEDRERKSNK
jgi:hypothetical protein